MLVVPWSMDPKNISEPVALRESGSGAIVWQCDAGGFEIIDGPKAKLAVLLMRL